MRMILWCSVLSILLVCGFAIVGQSQTSERVVLAADRPSNEEQQRQIKRGDYLTHDVSMCVICHSPKDEYGQVVKGQEFQGGTIPVSSPFPKAGRWAEHAPALRPIVAGQEDNVYVLLTTGIWRGTGVPPLSPMPPFRLNDEDARAIIAYLKSIQSR